MFREYWIDMSPDDQIPVRQVSLESTPSSSTISSCRKVIEAMALVRPEVKWTLWEEKTGATPANGLKKLISINGVSGLGKYIWLIE
jgi:DNA mismatch repair ATPase MutL